MANVYKFDNSAFGGEHNYTFAVENMPLEPDSPVDIINRNIHYADGGKIWSYEKFKSTQRTLQFEDVSTVHMATMGSIIEQNKKFAVYFGNETLLGDAGLLNNYLIGTYMWASKNFSPKEDGLGLWAFDFEMQQETYQ